MKEMNRLGMIGEEIELETIINMNLFCIYGFCLKRPRGKILLVSKFFVSINRQFDSTATSSSSTKIELFYQKWNGFHKNERTSQMQS